MIDSGDNPNAEWDLNQYRSTYGQPPCTTRNDCFAKLNQSGSAGNYPKADPGDGLEIDLDIEMVSATCPNCRIMLVEANTAQIADLAASVDTAVAEGANVVSNSYQVLGNSVDDAYGSHYDHPGVVVLVQRLLRLRVDGYAVVVFRFDAGRRTPDASQRVAVGLDAPKAV